MTTGIASGLGATFGVKEETTWGTFAASSRWIQHDKESLRLKKKTVQSQGLHGGLYELADRRAYVTRTADGPVDFDVTERQMGVFLKHMVGASSPVITTPTAGVSLMTFTPGPLTGMSLSLQMGRPQTDGTIQPFSYPGAKITDWELSVAAEQIAKLALTFDAQDELTAEAYAAASYVPCDVLQFAEGSLILGGTVSTTGGVASVTGGTALSVVKSASIKGSNPLDVARYFLGGSGTKAEQLDDGFRKLTGSVEAEFENLTDVYDAFAADTATALQLTFTGSTIASTYKAELNVLIPSIRWEEGPPTVDGPKILDQKLTFTGLDDGTNPVVQLQYQTADTAP